jgi:hypothetical protein
MPRGKLKLLNQEKDEGNIPIASEKYFLPREN